MFKKITAILVGVVMISAGLMAVSSIEKVQASPETVSINATITADNDYALYYGTENGSSITLVGSNDVWPSAENWGFAMEKGDYIYVAAWGDNAVAQGLLGQFVTDLPSTILTNTDWQVYLTFEDKVNGAAAPTTSEMSNKIAGAVWSPVLDFIDHGSGPWGTIAGIDSAADWIWGSALTPGSGYGEYQIFRIQVGEVDRTRPEAACVETVNPHGSKVPPAGSTTLPGSRGGQNEDGFYELLAVDNLPGVQIFVNGFGPFNSGDKIKVTEAPGAIPSQKKIGSIIGQAGAILWHLILNSDPVMTAIDAAGNVTTVTCLVPPPPK